MFTYMKNVNNKKYNWQKNIIKINLKLSDIKIIKIIVL